MNLFKLEKKSKILNFRKFINVTTDTIFKHMNLVQCSSEHVEINKKNGDFGENCLVGPIHNILKNCFNFK